jgi:selenium metabolism protein YedF
MEPTAVMLVTAATIGRGSDDLGGILTRNLLRMVRDSEQRPSTLIFLNGGVYLTTEGSPVKDELDALEALGIELLSCGTCLDFFQLRDKVQSGRASNMGEIYSRLAGAAKVISL